MLTIFSLGANFFQDQQNFRFRIGRLILDFADIGSANVSIYDYGLGYVLFNKYSYGNNSQISFFSLLVKVKGFSVLVLLWMDESIRGIRIGTEPERRYTLGINWFDDNELLTNFAEYNVFGDKNKDWSDQGLNKGVPRQRVLIRQVR
jgi:hypothetical protein